VRVFNTALRTPSQYCYLCSSCPFTWQCNDRRSGCLHHNARHSLITGQSLRAHFTRSCFLVLPLWRKCLRGHEGLSWPDGKARLFRPDMNMRRLERSYACLALPVSTTASHLLIVPDFLTAHRRRCRFGTDKVPGRT
jgi:hypothetical protein